VETERPAKEALERCARGFCVYQDYTESIADDQKVWWTRQLPPRRPAGACEGDGDFRMAIEVAVDADSEDPRTVPGGEEKTGTTGASVF